MLAADMTGSRVEVVPRPMPRALDGPLWARGVDPAAAARLRLMVAEAAVLVAAPPARLEGLGDLGCLAVSIYHEARDQPRLGQRAVAAVIQRRAEVPRWGETVCDVVQPVQFSYLAADRSFPPILERAAWREALSVATSALAFGPAASVAEADHYHADYVAPAWREEMQVVARIGNHIFYRDPRTRVAATRDARQAAASGA